jgi:hypothetical protein
MATPDVKVRPARLFEAYAEAQRYLNGVGSLNYALEQLVADLKNHDIDYVVIGAVALFAHGYRRFTNNIDIVLTDEGLKRFVTPIGGRSPQTLCNYDADITSNKRVRSFPHGISIKVMTSGEYPGDGRPKPVSMPEPTAAALEIDGIKFVTLEKLVELKLASGITAPDRLKDLADVQELIKVRALPPEFTERLDPYVRDKFLELLESVEKARLVEERDTLRVQELEDEH